MAVVVDYDVESGDFGVSEEAGEPGLYEGPAFGRAESVVPPPAAERHPPLSATRLGTALQKFFPERPFRASVGRGVTPRVEFFNFEEEPTSVTPGRVLETIYLPSFLEFGL